MLSFRPTPDLGVLPRHLGLALTGHKAADADGYLRWIRETTGPGAALAVITVDQYAYEGAPFQGVAHVPHHLLVTAADDTGFAVTDAYPRCPLEAVVPARRLAR
ncbi:hypothetical protein [Streptomyces litchfieldiae]|uniref:Uncharacterized protein n=1 Tax=Streptomyces litchfieldiae TaxID=3075543 RepID=A0ABU2MQS6_9ACTN|nr:hypothetical protein [Streptomyces sp. DSM 44938]MDT0343985.1 hypothetical protein [Streptomyces sp. DSM 44938]